MSACREAATVNDSKAVFTRLAAVLDKSKKYQVHWGWGRGDFPTPKTFPCVLKTSTKHFLVFRRWMRSTSRCSSRSTRRAGRCGATTAPVWRGSRNWTTCGTPSLKLSNPSLNTSVSSCKLVQILYTFYMIRSKKLNFGNHSIVQLCFPFFEVHQTSGS